MEKLKPCLCGDSKIYIKWKETTYMASPEDWTEANNCEMFCENCGRRTKVFITPEEAWNAWNNREVEVVE